VLGVRLRPLAGLRRELREEASLEVEVGDFVGAFIGTYTDEPEAKACSTSWGRRRSSRATRSRPTTSPLRWFARDAVPPDSRLAFRWLTPAFRAWATAVSSTPRKQPKGRRRPFG